MALTKHKLGKLIAAVDERNRDEAVKTFYGINIDKEFMPTLADVSNVDAKNYKIVRTGRFVFSGMQTGRDECIRISLYSGEDPIIISPAYMTFEVNSDLVLPEYFFMLFLRREMDRLGWFLSDGSIRANLDWEVFCDIEVDLPPIIVQRKFANVFSALKRSEAYKSKLRDICPILIKGAIEESMGGNSP